MYGEWRVLEQEEKYYKYIHSILDFLLEEYTRIFGYDTMFNEDCIVFNNRSAESPMIITSNMPVRIQLAQEDPSYWSQTVFQLSHEMCHYAIRQRKGNKTFTLSWFEEIICEAASLYALEYASKEWHRCSLSQLAPSFSQSHATYLEKELIKETTDYFRKCDTVEKLTEYERKKLPENQRGTHRMERNFVYGLVSANPLELKRVLDYTKYIENNAITINFDKWLRDNMCSFLYELRRIQPLKF